MMDQDRGDVRGPIIVPRVDSRGGMDKGRPKPNGRRRGPSGGGSGERPRHHGPRTKVPLALYPLLPPCVGV